MAPSKRVRCPCPLQSRFRFGTQKLVSSVTSSAYRKWGPRMSFLAIFFTVFFFVAIVLGPIFGAEDRPGFLRPNDKPRRNNDPPPL
jgi:hypothetical protein